VVRVSCIELQLPQVPWNHGLFLCSPEQDNCQAFCSFCWIPNQTPRAYHRGFHSNNTDTTATCWQEDCYTLQINHIFRIQFLRVHPTQQSYAVPFPNPPIFFEILPCSLRNQRDNGVSAYLYSWYGPNVNFLIAYDHVRNACRSLAGGKCQGFPYFSIFISHFSLLYLCRYLICLLSLIILWLSFD